MTASEVVGLDAQTRMLMQELLLQVWERHHQTVLFITHDIEEALLLADRVCVMTARPGRIKKSIDVGIARPRAIEVTTARVRVYHSDGLNYTVVVSVAALGGKHAITGHSETPAACP